jgi:hypothetical protein
MIYLISKATGLFFILLIIWICIERDEEIFQ